MLGFIAYRECINEGVKEMIHLFNDTNIKSWVVSGDCSKFSCISSAHHSDIINISDHTEILINGRDEDMIYKEIKDILKMINE